LNGYILISVTCPLFFFQAKQLALHASRRNPKRMSDASITASAFIFQVYFFTGRYGECILKGQEI